MTTTNKNISIIIEEIGEMLEIIGNPKDQFRIIAYQNAARKIEMMGREITDIYSEDGIKGINKIPGIGESISEKIEEIIKTGKCKYYDDLMKKVPAPILSFTKIPGVGPHIAKDLYNSYHVKTINELKSSLSKDTSEKFFKAKTRENILKGIEALKNQSGRMLLSFAEPIAEEAISFLKSLKEVKQANSVGSLRRMKETIGDIDIVVSSSKPQSTINSFIESTFVERIISEGDTKTTIVHKKGPNVDLEVLPQDEYGSLLQHFTGSKEHNIALRTWAEKHGISLSEHGIKIQKSKFKSQKDNSKLKIIKCENEEKFYNALGMDWIPPELRENNGEIEAAFKHKIPKLVELDDIKADLHIHSTWSEGEMTVFEIAKYVQELGYEYIAITDHTAGLGITHGLKENDIKKYIDEINKIDLKFKIKNLKFSILSGVETNILANGNLDISDQTLSKLDVVIASIHSGFRESEEKITERLLKTIQNPNVDVIGHPSGRLLGSRPSLNINWKKIFLAAKKYNVAMEINSHPQRLDLNDELCRIAKDMGVKMIINTDSHHLEHFQNMRYGVAVARRGWLTKNDVLNTLSLEEFKNRLKK
jgi:DNA polymerase (family 10)